MAYLDPSDVFSNRATSPVLIPDDPEFTLIEPENFQPTEWAVISMARHDSLATLREPHRSRLGRLLFGQPRHYNLAAERLEALRWLAVEAWHQPREISLAALGGFIAQGFSNAQLALLLATTGASRAMAGQGAAPIAAPEYAA